MDKESEENNNKERLRKKNIPNVGPQRLTFSSLFCRFSLAWRNASNAPRMLLNPPTDPMEAIGLAVKEVLNRNPDLKKDLTDYGLVQLRRHGPSFIPVALGAYGMYSASRAVNRDWEPTAIALRMVPMIPIPAFGEENRYRFSFLDSNTIATENSDTTYLGLHPSFSINGRRNNFAGGGLRLGFAQSANLRFAPNTTDFRVQSNTSLSIGFERNVGGYQMSFSASPNFGLTFDGQQATPSVGINLQFNISNF